MKPGSLQHNAGFPARVEIKTGPVGEAKRALAEHEASRPDYIKATHPNAPIAILKAWERWRDDHQHLRTALEMAETLERVGWRDSDGNRVSICAVPAKPKTQAPPKTHRNAAQFVNLVKQRIAAMAEHEPGSPEWRAQRNRAAEYMKQGIRRADTDGDPRPVFPPLPMPPEHIRKPKRKPTKEETHAAYLRRIQAPGFKERDAARNRAIRANRLAQGKCPIPGCKNTPQEGRKMCAQHVAEAGERRREKMKSAA